MRTQIVSLLACGLLVSACGGGRDRGRVVDTNNSTSTPRCGDGVVQAGEACEAGQLGDLTCEIFGFGAGTLGCDSDCTYDRSRCGAPATCGNGARDGVELCDGADFGGATCQSFGFDGGALVCAGNCGYISRAACTSAAQCGNGAREGAEVCDGADLNGASCTSLGQGEGTLACNSTCDGYDTSACSTGCTPECGGRVCGPDPVCGVSCGTCSEGMCNAQGQCEVAAENAPRILNFATNVAQITRGQSVVFSVIVTDPDGISDVIGGALETDAGGVYGTFATSDNEGAYSFELSWNQMNQVIPIEFTTEEQRTFVARFYDVAGHQVTGTVQVRLHCNGDAACDGSCRDLSSDYSNCGRCDRQCPGESQCTQGTCVGIAAAVPGQTCASVCSQGVPGSSCQAACTFEGSAVLAAGAYYYCESGTCTEDWALREYACTDTVVQSYTAADMSNMVYDYGGCCCVIP